MLMIIKFLIALINLIDLIKSQFLMTN